MGIEVFLKRLGRGGGLLRMPRTGKKKEGVHSERQEAVSRAVYLAVCTGSKRKKS